MRALGARRQTASVDAPNNTGNSALGSHDLRSYVAHPSVTCRPNELTLYLTIRHRGIRK